MKKDRIAQLEKQVAELKAEIEALKARPRTEYHYHTHLAPFIQPLLIPQSPTPWQPHIGPTCGDPIIHFNTCGQSDTNRTQLVN